jgi:Rv0078B-related antitoxin
MWLDPKRYEIMDDQMAQIMRAKTPGEKLAIAESLWRMARGLIRGKLRQDNPKWSEAEIDRETARRMSGGAF